MKDPSLLSDAHLSAQFEYSFFSPSSQSPDLKTFWGRFFHFQGVVNPRNFLATQESIDSSVKLIEKYKQQEIDT